MPRCLPFAVIPIAIAITFVLVGAAPARADFTWDHELSTSTHYGGSLGRHLKSPGPDGGLMAFGWRRGNVSVLATIIGRDALTVNGGHDDNLVSLGAGFRLDRRINGRLWWSLRAGAGFVDLCGETHTTLETSQGLDVNAAARASVRLLRDKDVELLFVVELLGQHMWLYPDEGKRIDGTATSLLVGFELGSRR